MNSEAKYRAGRTENGKNERARTNWLALVIDLKSTVTCVCVYNQC